MQKISNRKLSLLGLVLLAASSVTAAFMQPENKKDAGLNGSLTGLGIGGQTNDGRGTCTVSTAVDGDSCDASTAANNSGTTGGTVGTAAHVTAQNTTDKVPG